MYACLITRLGRSPLTDFWSPPLIRCMENPPRTIVGGPGARIGAHSIAGRFVVSLMQDTCRVRGRGRAQPRRETARHAFPKNPSRPVPEGAGTLEVRGNRSTVELAILQMEARGHATGSSAVPGSAGTWNPSRTPDV